MTAETAANCQACSSRYGRSYNFYSDYPSSYSSSNSYGSGSSGKSRTKFRWPSAGSSILYTPEEIRTLTLLNLINLEFLGEKFVGGGISCFYKGLRDPSLAF